MRSGGRLALEISPEQEKKMRAILRLRKGELLEEHQLAQGRKLLLVEKR